MNEALPVVQVTVSSTNVVEDKQEQAEEEDTVNSDGNYTFEPLLPKHIPQDPELPVLASCDQVSPWHVMKWFVFGFILTRHPILTGVYICRLE